MSCLRALSSLFARWTFFSEKKRNSFSSNRQSVGWAGGGLEGDETTLNERREKRRLRERGDRGEGVELERNVARKRGASDSKGIQTFHSWPVCCYV